MENLIATWLNEPVEDFVNSKSDDNTFNNVSHSNQYSDTQQQVDSSSDEKSLNSVSN